jgi:hypothetical protein
MYSGKQWRSTMLTLDYGCLLDAKIKIKLWKEIKMMLSSAYLPVLTPV